MIARVAHLLTLSVLIGLIAGCAALLSERTIDGNGDQPLLRLHEHSEPIKLSLRYRSPYAGTGHIPDEPSLFAAYVIPAKEGGSYSLTLYDDGNQSTLLVLDAAAAYMTGAYPAVGSGQVGTHGQGTNFILEAADDSDMVYVYVLEQGGDADDPENTQPWKVYVFRRGVQTIEPTTVNEGRYKGFRIVNGDWHVITPSPDVLDGTMPEQRKEVYERLRKFVNSHDGVSMPELPQSGNDS